MTNTDPTPDPAAHWGSKDMANQPPRELVANLGRLVAETRSQLGCDCSQEQVLQSLQERGLDVTADDVSTCWEQGC